MDRYRDSIYFMLLKMVNNRDDADDRRLRRSEKLSISCISTPRIMHSVRGCSRLLNNCIDFIEKKKKKQLLSLDKPLEGNDGGEMTMDVILEPSILKRLTLKSRRRF